MPQDFVISADCEESMRKMHEHNTLAAYVESRVTRWHGTDDASAILANLSIGILPVGNNTRYTALTYLRLWSYLSVEAIRVRTFRAWCSIS